MSVRGLERRFGVPPRHEWAGSAMRSYELSRAMSCRASRARRHRGGVNAGARPTARRSSAPTSRPSRRRSRTRAAGARSSCSARRAGYRAERPRRRVTGLRARSPAARSSRRSHRRGPGRGKDAGTRIPRPSCWSWPSSSAVALGRRAAGLVGRLRPGRAVIGGRLAPSATGWARRSSSCSRTRPRRQDRGDGGIRRSRWPRPPQVFAAGRSAPAPSASEWCRR